ncbi:MAG: ATP-binding protein [Clostridia bacterium]|nr:ATP-binding protein [Clostridia bacterium]
MKNSIKRSISILCIGMVVIVYIATILLSQGILDVKHIFSLSNIIFLFIIVVISYILSCVVSKMIILPLKKIEKGMRTVAEGKIPDTKHLKEYGNLKEIDDTVDAYVLMMELIKKNNFDLNSQQSKTEIILEHMADGVVAFSISRQIVHMNKAAMRLLNITASDDNFDKISEKLKINLDFDKIMYLPNYTTFEVKTNVEENDLNIVFAPFFSDRLTPMGVIMMVRNITETVRLDNVRKEFVANVSHELKTPLTSIKGYSETMMNGDLTYQEVIKFSKVINQEANRMGRLVSDLLQLSRFDYKRVSWKKMLFPINDLVLKVCEKMKFEAEEKNHTLECICADNIPSVYADRDAVEQVIMNILSNSIKYTPNGGIIKVYVGAINESIYIKVVDNGIGIPEKDLNRIFERFYRVDKTRSRKMGGTGLGLSIVKEIIEGMDGTIDIKSKVNEGTEVVVTLPTKMSIK